MTKYKLMKGGVYNRETGSVIPEYIGNREWRQFLEWTEEGNTPEPAYTAEELVEKERQDSIINFKSSIKKKDIILFRMLLELYRVGVAKGLWDSSDFPADLSIKVNEIKQELDSLTALGVD